MKARSALVYTVLRLLVFLVPFGLLMLLPIMREYYWLAAVFAALIGLSLSMLFLRRPLAEMTSGLGAGREDVAPPLSDEDVEDAATDGADTSRPAPETRPAATTDGDRAAHASDDDAADPR